MFTIDFIFYKTGTTNKKLSVAPVNITYYIFKHIFFCLYQIVELLFV